MSYDQLAKTQLDKVREMRKELSRINNTLARMEMLLGQAIQGFNRNPLAHKGIGNDSSPHLVTQNELRPLEGWVKSMVESYLAIAAAISIWKERDLSENLKRFVAEQQAKHEHAVALFK